MRKARKRLWIIGTLIVAAFGWVASPRTPSDPFEAWAVLSQEHRHRVAEQLIADGVLIGMTETEVRQRLGDGGFTWDDGKAICWYIGDPPTSGWFTWDSDYLEVKIEGGRVVSARIWTSRY